MTPVSKDITSLDQPRENPLQASVDMPPNWKPSYLSGVPFVGTLFSIMGNASRYNTKFEDCADFTAADLEKPHGRFVGKRIGINEVPKGKVNRDNAVIL